jgi:hypothetical protein
MIRDIATDLLYLTVPTLICACLLIYSVSVGLMPPICGVCALRLQIAQYEAVGVDVMDDSQKEAPNGIH